MSIKSREGLNERSLNSLRPQDISVGMYNKSGRIFQSYADHYTIYTVNYEIYILIKFQFENHIKAKLTEVIRLKDGRSR